MCVFVLVLIFFWISNSPKQPTFRLLGQTNTIFILYSVKTFFPGKVTCNTFSKKYFINAQTEKERQMILQRKNKYLYIPHYEKKCNLWKAHTPTFFIIFFPQRPGENISKNFNFDIIDNCTIFSIFRVLYYAKKRTWFT